MMARLLEPFSFPFMVDGLIVGCIVAAACAVLSCFLVLKGWSLMGDAVAHAVLPGIVLAYIAGIPLAAGAFGAGLLCAVGTGWIKAVSRVKEDTVLGVVFTGMFAFGLVLFAGIQTDLHLDHILIGNLLGVQPRDLREVAWIGGLTAIAVLLLRRDLLLMCFDAGHARAIGLGTGFLYYFLLVALAATIVASLKAVGIILVVAMLVTPGSIGFLMSERFDRMLAAAVASAVGSTVAGLYISFHLDASPAACIVLAQTVVFVFALVFAPKRGVLARRAISG
jgi:ABC-type Mn2+/Zn2+ transport system permease subunit